MSPQRNWLPPSLLTVLAPGCISLRAPAPTRHGAGVGDCPPGTLTNACREREWQPGEAKARPCPEPCARGLEKDEILRVMRRRRGSVGCCYVLALERDEPFAAKLTASFTIDAAQIKGTTDEPLAACVWEALQDFEFPRPHNGRTVNVTFPYVFGAGDADGGT